MEGNLERELARKLGGNISNQFPAYPTSPPVRHLPNLSNQSPTHPTTPTSPPLTQHFHIRFSHTPGSSIMLCVIFKYVVENLSKLGFGFCLPQQVHRRKDPTLALFFNPSLREELKIKLPKSGLWPTSV